MLQFVLQEISASIVDGNDSVTGHIISTTIGGKNGEPKQVMHPFYVSCDEIRICDLICFGIWMVW